MLLPLVDKIYCCVEICQLYFFTESPCAKSQMKFNLFPLIFILLILDSLTLRNVKWLGIGMFTSRQTNALYCVSIFVFRSRIQTLGEAPIEYYILFVHRVDFVILMITFLLALFYLDIHRVEEKKLIYPKAYPLR